MEDGTHQAKLSASGTYLIDYFTSNNVPREISILPTTGKKVQLCSQQPTR